MESEVLMRVASLSGRRGRGRGRVMSSLPRRLPRSCLSSESSLPPSHSGTRYSSPEDEEEEKEFSQLHLFHKSVITNVWLVCIELGQKPAFQS